MTENVRKIFDMLGVEPYEKFMIESVGIVYIDENLIIQDEKGFCLDNYYLLSLLTGKRQVLKLPKKKHVGDLTCIDFENCMDCPVRAINSYCRETYSLYDNLKEYNDEIQDKEIYDILKKRLDEEVEE